jgi:hypothetical protein
MLSQARSRRDLTTACHAPQVAKAQFLRHREVAFRADRLQTINPIGTYTSCFFLDVLNAPDDWRRTSGTGGSQNNAPIFRFDGSVFIRRISAPYLDYRIPVPWSN